MKRSDWLNNKVAEAPRPPLKLVVDENVKSWGPQTAGPSGLRHVIGTYYEPWGILVSEDRVQTAANEFIRMYQREDNIRTRVVWRNGEAIQSDRLLITPPADPDPRIAPGPQRPTPPPLRFSRGAEGRQTVPGSALPEDLLNIRIARMDEEMARMDREMERMDAQFDSGRNSMTDALERAGMASAGLSHPRPRIERAPSLEMFDAHDLRHPEDPEYGRSKPDPTLWERTKRTLKGWWQNRPIV